MNSSLPLFLCCAGVGLLSAEFLLGSPMRWQAVIGSSHEDSEAESRFIAIEGQEAVEGLRPARAFLAGEVDEGDEFSFGGLPELGNGDDHAVVVGVSDHGEAGWAGDWQAWVRSDGEVEITDLAISDKHDQIYVCGSFVDGGSFDSTGSPGVWNFWGPKEETGFVAIIDPESGKWGGAVRLENLRPESIAIDADGNVFVAGEDTLVAKYTYAVELLWSVPAAAGSAAVQVAIGPGQGEEFVYVLSEDGGDSKGQNLELTQLDNADGSERWSLRMGSKGEDSAGGLDVAATGDALVSYSSKHVKPLFDGQLVEMAEAVDACHSLIARVCPDGSAEWVRPIGNAVDGEAESWTRDLDIDSSGVAWVCGRSSGKWSFEDGASETFDDDAVLFAIDPAGAVIQHHRSTWSSANVDALAVAAAGPELVMVAGDYEGGSGMFEPLMSFLPKRESVGGFFALVEPRDGDRLMVLRPNPENLSESEQEFIENLMNYWGKSAYASVENGPLGTALSVWLIDSEVEFLGKDDKLIIEPEVMMMANGVVYDAGWALAKLGSAKATAPWTYTYPETANEVVLYLIDTAVTNPDGWFNRNANLKFEERILVRGSGDPTESSEFDHGTKMLSLIAGPGTGAAQGTPIRLVNYDIYPDGQTTTATLVAKAVLAVAQRHQQDKSGARGVICLATSSQSKGTSMTLEMAIDYAVDAGLPVVVSAGNSGEDASSFIPAGYGAEGGVICVGAIDAYNQPTSISNYGGAVDLYAPGENVRCLDMDDWEEDDDGDDDGEEDDDGDDDVEYGFSSGTSPATALTAAAALVELSQDRSWEPEEVEKLLYGNSYAGAALSRTDSTAIRMVQMGPYGVVVIGPVDPGEPVEPGEGGTGTVDKTEFENWASSKGLPVAAAAADSDGDGIIDLMEFVQGSDPLVEEESVRTIIQELGSDEISYEFEISADLFDAQNPQTLLDGTGWEIQCSDDMVNWKTASGALDFAATEEGRVLVKVGMVPETEQCFLRIALTPVVVKTVVATPVVLTPVDQ